MRLALFASMWLCAPALAQAPSLQLDFEAETDSFGDAVAEYRAIWQVDGERIVEVMERLTGLEFEAGPVHVIVHEGTSFSGYRDIPMRMRASYAHSTKQATLVHELAHRLISELVPSTFEDHPIIFLFVYDAWVELWGREFADREVEVESARRGPSNYRGTWQSVLALSAEERAQKFQQFLREPEAAPLRLPLQIIRSSAVTEIRVGNQTVQAGVDTGGGGLTLSEDVIRTAGGVRLPDDLEWNDAFGRVYRVPQFRIPVMNIGGRTFRDAVVSQAVDWPEGEGPPVPNGIGGDFLSQYFAVIDFAGRSITLWPADSPPLAYAACGTVRVPMEETEQSGLVVSKFETPAGTIRLIWDTGASYSVLPLSLVESSKLETILRGQTPFHTPAKLVAAGHEFGPLEFVVLPLQLPNDDFQGMLGANFFTTHVVCIDYGKREIRVR